MILIISLSLLIGYFNGSKINRLEKEDFRHEGCLLGLYKYVRDNPEMSGKQIDTSKLFNHCTETIMELNEEISREIPID